MLPINIKIKTLHDTYTKKNKAKKTSKKEHETKLVYINVYLTSDVFVRMYHSTNTGKICIYSTVLL